MDKLFFYGQIVFTQIPKALSVLVLGKKTKSVLGSQINVENSLWPFFFFDFSQVLPEVTINKNSNFI